MPKHFPHIYGRATYVERPPSILIREISDYGVLTELDNEDVRISDEC